MRNNISTALLPLQDGALPPAWHKSSRCLWEQSSTARPSSLTPRQQRQLRSGQAVPSHSSAQQLTPRLQGLPQEEDVTERAVRRIIFCYKAPGVDTYKDQEKKGISTEEKPLIRAEKALPNPQKSAFRGAIKSTAAPAILSHSHMAARQL